VRNEEEREEEEGLGDRHCCSCTQSPRWAVCLCGGTWGWELG
jgi:hypothetical protein